MRTGTILVAGACMALSACGGGAEQGAPPARPPAVTSIDCEGGTLLDVPSDARAKYCILERGGTAARPTIVTKRAGSSGVSYSRREYDCARGTFRYLGDGETRAAMEASRPEPTMAPLVEGSISYDVGLAACGR